mmetsp:Transcript_64440/g.199598  ORF Transcript_64440/g.199598 Transcript_64440/m.199598 type:complete len:284 (-) Transcript_64440:107-958(-)
MLQQEVQHVLLLGPRLRAPREPPGDEPHGDGQASVPQEDESPDGVQEQRTPPEVHDGGRRHHEAVVLEGGDRQVGRVPMATQALLPELVLDRTIPELKVHEEDRPTNDVHRQPIQGHDLQDLPQGLVLQAVHLREGLGGAPASPAAGHAELGHRALPTVPVAARLLPRREREGRARAARLLLLCRLRAGEARSARRGLAQGVRRRLDGLLQESWVRVCALKPDGLRSDSGTQRRLETAGRPVQAIQQLLRHARLHAEGEPPQQQGTMCSKEAEPNMISNQLTM